MLSEKRILYLANYGTSKTNATFIVSALRKSGKKKCNTLMGMRGIQDTIILKPDDSEITFRGNWG